jgi:hypothetical protein
MMSQSLRDCMTSGVTLNPILYSLANTHSVEELQPSQGNTARDKLSIIIIYLFILSLFYFLNYFEIINFLQFFDSC